MVGDIFMKLLPISQGKVTQVDDEDFEWLSRCKWYYSSGYAKRYDKRGRSLIRIHREILEHYGHNISGMHVDHIDGNPLNNIKSNLRIATHSQNLSNRGKPISNTSGYKGVSWNKGGKFYEAYITVNKKRIRLGYYDNPEHAARVYDLAAIELHKEFAVLNFPDDIQSSISIAPRKTIIQSNNSSGYRGVSYRKDNKKWRAEINYQGRKIIIGLFITAIEAAKAYNQTAIKYLGEKAKLNDIPA